MPSPKQAGTREANRNIREPFGHARYLYVVALALDGAVMAGVFSAEASRRRRSSSYRSAMSMLTFYINRAGANLPNERREVLESAKDELRKAFGRQ